MATRDTPRKPKKGEPFTVRFSPATQQAIEAEARRTKRTRTAVVEELADEALRMRLFPGIAFHDEFPFRDAYLLGAGLEVWELCELLQIYPDHQTLVDAFPRLEQKHIDLALAYREAYRDEIDGAIAENNRPREDLRRLYPFIRDARAEGLIGRDADPAR